MLMQRNGKCGFCNDKPHPAICQDWLIRVSWPSLVYCLAGGYAVEKRSDIKGDLKNRGKTEGIDTHQDNAPDMWLPKVDPCQIAQKAPQTTTGGRE